MKRIIAFMLAFVICISLCACAKLSPRNTISFNEDYSEIYYNGCTYVEYDDTKGKYCLDPTFETGSLVEVATMPYGFFYILGAVTRYYGDSIENPAFITNSRTWSFYGREDLVFDHNSDLSLQDVEQPYHFRISNATTGEVIAYDYDKRFEFNHLCNFFATFAEYPSLELWIRICEHEGKLYLQDTWDSDYYEITDAFVADIYRLGLNTYDYRAR